MSEPADQFKRAPKRKRSPGKSVAVSAEAKQAYEEVLRQREEREKSYARHLPADAKPR
jgi:hypothetical protein